MEIAPFYEPESCTWTYLLSDNTTHSAAIFTLKTPFNRPVAELIRAALVKYAG